MAQRANSSATPGSGGRRPRRKAKRRERLTAVYIEPMKALGVTTVPPGDWRVEIKFDGYRAIATLRDGAVALWSRNHKPLTADYPEVTTALAATHCRSAVFDGEIVAVDRTGRSRFQLLQGRGLTEARPAIVYYVFDLLQTDGRSWLDEPIEKRREQLEKIFPQAGAGAVRLSPVFDVAPAALLDEARQKGLEGIVAKAAGSRYEPGRRSGAWLKCRLASEQEFVIGGFTPPRNSRSHFGAVLVGYYEKGKLMYAGKVGTGFDRAGLAELHEKFEARRTTKSPFANLPMTRRPRFGQGMTAGAMREVCWIRPDLVAQVRFAEWTADGLLRQPVFLGLRRDKAATEVVREAPAV